MKWAGDTHSPVSNSVPKAKGASYSFADQYWTESTSKMIRLAQALVVNSLLSWASLSVIGSRHKDLPSATDEVFELVGGNNRVVTTSTMPAQRGDLVYVNHAYAIGGSEGWTFEPVMEGEKPVLDNGQPVYHIRNTRTGRCIVAGDVWDGSVYLQDPAGRLNGQWVLHMSRLYERPKDRKQYFAYRVCDRKHGKYLFLTQFPLAFPGTVGPLTHQDRSNEWIRIAPSDFGGPTRP